MTKLNGLKIETKGSTVAAQNRSLPTRNFQENIIKNPDQTHYVDLAKKNPESIAYLVSGYSILTPIFHKERDDKTK